MAIIHKISNIEIDESEFEDGIIETYDLLNDKSDRLKFILEDLRQSIKLMSENINKRTKATKGILKITDNKLRLKKAKIISNRAADDLNNFSEKLEVDFDPFKNSYFDVINSFTTVHKELQYEKDSEESKVMRSLQDSIKTAINGFGEMFISLNDIPKMTAKVGIAKSRLLKLLKTYIEEMEFGYNLLNEMNYDD